MVDMVSSNTVIIDYRLAILLLFVLGTLALVSSISPIPQDIAYHSFADTRSFMGIPNFWDVASNFPFLIVGLLGISRCLKTDLGRAQPAWVVFFIGVTLVSAGSSYYHWNPGNNSLVWDRLPMTVGFMGLFVALLGEYISPKLVHRLLIPMILFGAATVVHWHLYDDLRFYAWVQFMPLVVVVILMTLYRSRFTHSWLLMVALFWYLLAKVFEAYDVEIFRYLQGIFSGHAIKHLLAAAGCYTLLLFLELRRAK